MTEPLFEREAQEAEIRNWKSCHGLSAKPRWGTTQALPARGPLPGAMPPGWHSRQEEWPRGAQPHGDGLRCPGPQTPLMQKYEFTFYLPSLLSICFKRHVLFYLLLFMYYLFVIMSSKIFQILPFPLPTPSRQTQLLQWFSLLPENQRATGLLLPLLEELRKRLNPVQHQRSQGLTLLPYHTPHCILPQARGLPCGMGALPGMEVHCARAAGISIHRSGQTQQYGESSCHQSHVRHLMQLHFWLTIQRVKQ